MSLLTGASEIPRQTLPLRKKDEEWKKKCIDAFYNISYFSSMPHTSYELQEKMYDLYNGIIHDDDYTHVLKPYGKKRKNFPAQLHNYPILKPAIDLLIGEQRKRPFNFTVSVKNPNVTTKKAEEKKKQITQALQKEFVDLVEGQKNPEEVKPPKELEEAFEQTYRDQRAINGQKALNIIEADCEVKRKIDDKGFKDWCVAGEFYTLRDVIGNQLHYEILNPLHVDSDKSPELEFVEDGDWAVVRKYCQPSQVVDEYFDVLTKKDIQRIEDDTDSTTGDWLLYDSTNPQEEDSFTNLVEVVKVFWKSRKKVGFVTYEDQFGQIQEKQVDEYYEMQPNDLEVEWFWINEVWHGTRINEDIYCNIEPYPVQRRDMDNPSQCKLPINGRRYSDRNSANVSLMMLGYPYQLMYNILKYRLENSVAKSKDVIAQLDINMIPEDWDMDKFMYYMDATGIAWQSYAKEGIQPNPHAQQVLDLTLKTAEQYISLMEYTKQEMMDLIGINAQRQGNVEQYEKKANTEYAIVQSSHMTEHLFAKFQEVVEKDMRALVDYSKYAWINGKSTQYTMPDNTQEFIDIDGIEHMETEYGIYVTDSRKEMRKMQEIQGLGQAMLQNDTSLETIVDIMEAESFTQIKERVKEAEKARQELIQAQQKAEQAQAQQEQELEMAKLENDYQMNKEDNETDILIERMKQGADMDKKEIEREMKQEELEVKREDNRSNERIAREQMKQQNNSE